MRNGTMKAKEVLKILNVSRLTLHNYVRQGKIKLDNVVNSHTRLTGLQSIGIAARFPWRSWISSPRT